jgi:hypothetical protein
MGMILLKWEHLMDSAYFTTENIANEEITVNLTICLDGNHIDQQSNFDSQNQQGCRHQ